MATKTEDAKKTLLETLLNEARDEADALRKKLAHCERIILSTRLVMGHELKKPTTAISGYLDLVCEDLEKADALKTLAFAEKARAECQLLNELNAFYLDLLKLDSEEGVVGPNPVDAGAVVREVVSRLPQKLRAPERVRVHVAERVPPVHLNRNALSLVVMNLLENALLYSQVAAPVRVEVDCTPDRRGGAERELLRIRVVDDGIGIPDEYLKMVFNPFVRLREDVAAGSGLGLTLVRSLVELSGGDVFIRSEASKGTTVHVTIPTGGGADGSER
jgi:signal transduction histidine kinase